MKIVFTLKKSLLLVLPCMIWLAGAKKSLAQENKVELTSTNQEMALPVRKYSAGLRDLRRAYHNMTYTVLAKKEKAYFKKWKNKLSQYPFDQFSREAKVDYILLRNTIKMDEYSLNKQQRLWKSLQPALPFADQILRLSKMRRWGQTPDAKEVAATCDSIGRSIKNVQQNLGNIDLKAVHNLSMAMRTVRSLRQSLQDVFHFYDGYNPLFTWWVPASYNKTDSLFAVYIDSLRSKISQNIASHDSSGI